METEITDTFPEELVDGQYKLKEMLYQTQTGPACTYENQEDETEYLVKFDPPKPFKENKSIEI